MGAYADPEKYMETRYMIQETINRSIPIVEEVARDFTKRFGRTSPGLFENYRIDDASTVVIAMGSMAGTIKDVIDELRDEGEKVGILRLICYRPFPKEALYNALRHADNIVVMEKDISLGGSGAVATDLRSVFQGRPETPVISGFVLGLGGRDVTKQSIRETIHMGQEGLQDARFIGLKEDLELEGIDA
jgi:pyruvate ferredoxin oxidoreductase alpha subunit